MPEVRVGPLLRHVGETDATIWVETDKSCRVEILGHSADTFEVEGHHFAIVCVEGLDQDRVHPYEIHLDGDRAWPPDDYEFPKPRVRLMPHKGNLRLLFDSCRASAPHRPPYTFQGWWHPKGKGIDVLRVRHHPNRRGTGDPQRGVSHPVGRHIVTAHRHGTKQFRHPEFGELTLTYNVLAVAAVPGLSVVGYTAEPNSPSAHAIQILGSWRAADQPTTVTRTERDIPTTASE